MHAFCQELKYSSQSEESLPFDRTCIESSASSLPAVWILILEPSFTILNIRSTGNQRCNCDPMFAMFLHRFRQLCVFFCCPFTHFLLIATIRYVGPSSFTLIIRSIGNLRSNGDPIVAMILHRLRQFCVFFWFPFTLLPDFGRIQRMGPSLPILNIRSTGNQRCNCDPMFAIFLHRFRQLCVFFSFPTVTRCTGHRSYHSFCSKVRDSNPVSTK
jgi:hypothetical protein